MPRGRRPISAADAGGISLLAVFLAIVLTGALGGERDVVAGTAHPRPAAGPAGPAVADGVPSAEPEAGTEPRDPAVPAEHTGAGLSTIPPVPETPVTRPAEPRPPAAPPDSGPGPATVRLARGGTATLVRTEVGPDGVLPVPSALNKATWWGAGLRAPSGATVLAGHVNWKGATGPFAELWDSRIGDPVLVVDQQGRPRTYRVSQISTLDKGDLPASAEELFGQHGPHRLVLVTCGGRWVGGDRGYASNQVVIALPTDGR